MHTSLWGNVVRKFWCCLCLLQREVWGWWITPQLLSLTPPLVVWRCFLEVFGAPCVMASSPPQTLKWCVPSWASPLQTAVGGGFQGGKCLVLFCGHHCFIYVLYPTLVLSKGLSLPQASCWMMLTATALTWLSFPVATMASAITTVNTLRMWPFTAMGPLWQLLIIIIQIQVNSDYWGVREQVLIICDSN